MPPAMDAPRVEQGLTRNDLDWVLGPGPVDWGGQEVLEGAACVRPGQCPQTRDALHRQTVQKPPEKFVL